METAPSFLERTKQMLAIRTRTMILEGVGNRAIFPRAIITAKVLMKFSAPAVV